MTIQIEDEGNSFFTITGIKNDKGEDELYRVQVLANGQIEVYVHRKRTGFAILNRNVHYTRCARVIDAFKRNR